MTEDEEPPYDYYADDAEAVIYMIFEKGRFQKNCLYVMKRSDAIKFCSSDQTCGGWGGRGKWSYAFTTYRRDWRESLDDFRMDDGRFDSLLKELGITPLWRKGQPVPPSAGCMLKALAPVSKNTRMEQLSLLNF